jgi:hypothetical protein
MLVKNRSVPVSSDAAYEELQALDYLNEFTPSQQFRYDFLENILPEIISGEQQAKQLLKA